MNRKDGKPREYVKGKKTKRKIVKSLMELLEKKGLDDITIQEICDLSEIHRSTFYRHFNSVFDVISFLTNEIMEALAVSLAVIDLRDNVFDFLIEFIHDYRKPLQNLYRTQYRDLLMDQVTELVENFFRQMFEAERPAIMKEIPVEWLAKYHAAGSIAMVKMYITEEQIGVPLHEKLPRVYDLIFGNGMELEKVNKIVEMS